MINVKFNNKRFKIYANGKIKCLDFNDHVSLDILKSKIEQIMFTYNNPSDGFPVSYLALHLPSHGVEVTSYRDYELENAKPGTIY